MSESVCMCVCAHVHVCVCGQVGWGGVRMEEGGGVGGMSARVCACANVLCFSVGAYVFEDACTHVQMHYILKLSFCWTDSPIPTVSSANALYTDT